jgi:hypothetical protein
MNPCRTTKVRGKKRVNVCGPPKTGIGILRRDLHACMHAYLHVKKEGICKRPRCLYLPHRSAALSRSFFVLQECKDRNLNLSRIDD